MFRPINESQEGEVTREEQIKALDRFIRWHARQVKVGRALLQQLGLGKAPPSLEEINATEDAWLNSETLKALVAVERFAAELKARDHGLASAVAVWTLIDATLQKWRDDAARLRGEPRG